MAGVDTRGLYFEPDLVPEARQSLTDTDLDLQPTPLLSELVGHANLILVTDEGSFDAGSDPRADGSASTEQLAPR